MAKVTPYLRTEWGVRWDSQGPFGPGEEPRQMESALIARQFVETYNKLVPNDPCKVVQRSISDWGDDE